MKSLIFLVLLGVVASAIAETRDKRWLFKSCSEDADCGVDRCCANYVKKCFDKRDLNQSCNFSHIHGCGCKDGLSCQVYYQLGSLKYYKCFEEAGSGGF